MAHMVWGIGGFLNEMGSVDFAGGNVVHISSGISALILCIALGKRNDYHHASYRGFIMCPWLLWVQRFFYLAGLDLIQALHLLQMGCPLINND